MVIPVKIENSDKTTRAQERRKEKKTIWIIIFIISSYSWISWVLLFVLVWTNVCVCVCVSPRWLHALQFICDGINDGPYTVHCTHTRTFAHVEHFGLLCWFQERNDGGGIAMRHVILSIRTCKFHNFPPTNIYLNTIVVAVCSRCLLNCHSAYAFRSPYKICVRKR